MSTGLKSKFKMSYGDLVQLADKAASLISRDTVELKLFGVLPADKIVITTQADNLRTFRTDQEMLGLQTIATAKKDDFRIILQKTVSNIMIRVKILHGIGSPEYNRYDTKELHNGSDSETVRLCYRVYRVATEELTSLITRGLTQQDLDDFLINIKLFDAALDEREKATRDRDRIQQERVEIANILYDKIVEVFECGKAVFETDPARYNDYIIYDSPSVGTGTSGNKTTEA
jgi:isopentenyl phosphate kinase